MKPPRTLTPKHVEILLAGVAPANGTPRQRALGLRNQLMILLMLDAGLRVGELVQLVPSDLVHYDEPVDTLYVRPEIAKRGRERFVPLTPRTRETTKTVSSLFWGGDAQRSPQAAFATASYRRPLTTRQVQRIVKDAARDRIGRWVTPHTLRHTFASNLMRVTNARIVQQLLGHASLQTTQVYTHPNNADLNSAIRDMAVKNGG